MNIDLSWDLLIIVVFAFVIGYSFIVGINRTLKIIIGVYLASLAADSIGNLANHYLLSASGFSRTLSLFNLATTQETLILFKIMIFSIATVVIATKGAFNVEVARPLRTGLATSVNGVFGFLNAGLVVSILLVYVSGLSFAQTASANAGIAAMYADSPLVKIMVNNHDLWFSVPVIALIIWSIFANRVVEEDEI